MLYNELDFSRQQNGEKKQPDYILVFKKDGQILNLDEAKKAQLDWDGKLPIVVVDVDRCLETEKAKVEKLKRQYEETPTEQLAKQIRQKVRNNRVTYSKFCPEIEDFLKEQPKREKSETKKTLKNSIGEKAGNAYKKVKQKPAGLVGISTAKKGNFMKLIENIKSEIEEYKHYKHPRHSNALTVQNSKSRSIFNYIQAKRLGRKYGDVLYKHFKVMDDVNSYDLLINLFGRRNIERALDNKEATTSQIADKLFEKCNIENLDKKQANYVLQSMMHCITFNRATGLDLSEIQHGINPETFARASLGNKSMLSIFEENEVTKDILKEIYDMYGKELVECYNNDAYLRNKTILKLDGKNEKTNAVGGLQDHVTYYSNEDFDMIFQKYFNNKELSQTEQYILIGLLAKEADLIGTYTVKHLREHPEYIKSEINVGIFDNIVLSGKTYTNKERKEIATLGQVWSKDDLNRYHNLGLLRQRLESLPETQDTLKTKHAIDEILAKPLSEIATRSSEISEFMDTAFMSYEIENRNQIVESVYNPEKTQEIVITDLAQMGSSAMLHFFNPNRTMSNFDAYVSDLEEKRSKELNREFKFSEDEKRQMLLQYQSKENHYITDYALDFEGIGQVGTFDTRYVTNTSNQLCAMVTTPKEILEGKGIRGQIALGFSRKTLNPELIATVSNKNIHSNKGIDYVESNNEFEDFSASYDELTSTDKKFGDNTEVVLFRNSYESSLKPSYVMYIGNDKLDSVVEKENLELVRKQMKEAGLDVPLVIFDRFSIKEKMKDDKLEQKQNEDERF